MLTLCALLWAAPLASPEEAGVAPGIQVSVIPFGPSEGCFIELLVTRELEPLGISVDVLAQGALPDDALAAGADYVIRGSVIDGELRSASATIQGGSLATPQEFSATGDYACRLLAEKISEFLGQPNTVGRYLASREAEAHARLSVDAGHHDSLLLLGMAERLRHNWSRALGYLERAIASDPEKATARFQAALCYKQLGDREGWFRELEKASSLDPQDPGVGIALGNFYAADGKPHLARAHYEKFLAVPRVSSLIRWNLAVLAMKEGQTAAAVEHLSGIPTDSNYYTEARAWIGRIGEAVSDSAPPLARQPVSIWSVTDLPEAFGTTLLLFLLALVAAGYLPIEKGVEVGPLKVPALPPRVRKSLRWVGPIGLLMVVSLYLPVWPLGLPMDAVDAPPLFEDLSRLGVPLGRPQVLAR